MSNLLDKIELIDSNTQNILKSKYNVTFYDTLSNILEEKKQLSVVNNPVIKRIDKMYNGELMRKINTPLNEYPIFKKYEKKEDEVNFDKIEIGKINETNDIVLEVNKGEHIFKGTRDFITLEKENKYLETIDELQPYWFGSLGTGYAYAKTYSGGLNAYKFNDDYKIFIVNDIRNEKKIIDTIKNLTNDELLKIGHNRYEILNSVRIKYGYDCDISYQIKFIEKYTGYNGLWLSRYISKDLYNSKIGKYRNNRMYGAGKLDRILGRFMCYFCKLNNYIGYCSLYNYSIFYSFGLLGDEIVICNQKKYLERDIKHELDWYQWKKYIDIDINSDIFKNYIFNPIFHTKKFLGVFSQYYNNQINNNRNKKILELIKKNKPKYTIMTFNVHSFVSSNLNDTYEITIKKLKELLDLFNIDFCFIEEYSSYINDTYFENIFTNYNIIKSPNLGNKYNKYFGNILLCKDKIKIYRNINLPNKKDSKRIATEYIIDNDNIKDLKIIGTHLEIGDRYTERRGSFKLPNQIIEIYNKNVNNRILQLNTIMEKTPDIILGDFNFTIDDPEFEHISVKYEDSMKEEYPTLFNNERVDFIFRKKEIKCNSYVVSYPYSDHLPVIGLLY
jgi:endonuclease/exonuclease/phosphatase family metal-dependent hydrolase